ncbi:DUF4349 domain-containing protein [Ectobacillus ponti]|uniref:DUF4349 domain-containing protein n=1 Tax=Ectobacillus ponti TaxID=2961894 RepID=A0AA42BQL8_9BACI|nr:DUF4349 domain-containing protein [Ectobacillus ponti]MCP8968589.1 DUF4349 domain-containing protein [Ectobacillus ponti]
MRKLFYLTFAIFLAVVSGCSNTSQEKTESSASKADMKQAGMQSQAADVKEKAADPQAESRPQVNRKLIKTVDLQVETTKLEESVQKLESLSKQFGGYVQSNQVQGTSLEQGKRGKRTASYVLRIPADQLDAYLKEAGSIGNVLSKAVGTEDVTEQYFDTEARLTSLKTQEERLLALLKQAGSLKDMLEIEKELAAVRYEIEQLTTTLKKYDGLVSYSTVRFTLTEVATITDTTEPKTTGERIARQFRDNITAIADGAQAAAVFLIGNSPILLLLAALAAGGFLIFRRVKQNRGNRNIGS